MMMYPYQLENLPYEYSALEPVISKQTLEFHHDKHLQAYTNNLNHALAQEAALQGTSLVDILKNIDSLHSNQATAIRNNGGGVFNHNFYFESLAEPFSKTQSEYLQAELNKSFGSVQSFMNEFKQAAIGQFGSGWAWLVINPNGKMEIMATANQDTPLKLHVTPLLNIDVWEHAYYLDYQNRRPDYVDQYLSIVDWDVVENRLREHYISSICRSCH
jgi:Fe-Mn family superoxide dismutase